MKFIILSLFLVPSAMGVGLVNGTLSPVPGNGTNSGGGGGQTNIAGNNITITTNGNYTTINASSTVSTAYNALTGVTTTTNADFQFPFGGGSAFADMDLATGQFFGQQIVTAFGANDLALFIAPSAGSTSNNLRKTSYSFPGGFNVVGNNLWADNTNIVRNLQTYFYVQYGSNASSREAAYGYTGTNSANANNINQPNFTVITGNPYAGNLFMLRGMSTDPRHGSFAGIDATGNSNYLQQFGLEYGTLARDYNTWATNGAGQPVGYENNQSGSMQSPLIADGLYDTYVSVNGGRSTDTGTAQGQVPLLVYVTSNLNAVQILFPYQVGDVWAQTNSRWKDTVRIQESRGEVDITNGPLVLSNTVNNASSFFGGYSPTLLGLSTNKGAYGFGNSYDTNAMMNINGDTSLNLPSGWNNNGGGFPLVTSYQGDHHFGIGLKSGIYMGMVTTTGREIPFYRSTASDLLSTAIGSQTFDKIMWIGTEGDFHVENNAVVGGITTSTQYIGKQSNLGGATAIDWTANTDYFTNLSANVTFTFVNNSNTMTEVVQIVGDASHTVTWPGSINWLGTAGRVAPTQTLNKTDVYTFHQINGVINGTVGQ